jgi:hypothetical protein
MVEEHTPPGAMLVGLEKVTHLISRCLIYEALYRTPLRSETALSILERRLVKLYTVVLRFLALSVRFSTCDPDKTASVIPYMKKFEQLYDEYGSHVDGLEAEARNCELVHQLVEQRKNVSKLQRLHAQLRNAIVRIDASTETLLDESSNAQQPEILLWVSRIPYESNHGTARRGRTHGTAEWILEHPTFREWRASSASSLLWLHGIRKLVFLFE